jgi:iron complex transport system ATP-binding protein
MSNVALSFDGLGHAYHPGRWVFRGYSAAIERGHIFAILGPNGAGKSTLLHVLLDALKPTEGTVSVYGRSAFVPQLFQTSFDYRVIDMVLMGRARRIGLFAQPGAQDEAAALDALDRFDLRNAAHRPFHELSGGQRQLVILARALVAEADILILDEPTSALDLKHQGEILEWIARVARDDGMTVVFTTHHPHHAVAIADDALLMAGEDDYRCGAAAEVLTERHLSELYGVELKKVSFEHAGQKMESFVPIFPASQPLPANRRAHPE